MESVLLVSQSPLKLKAVVKLFPADKYTVTCVSCDDHGLPSQPVNCTEACVQIRVNYGKQRGSYDYYIAIENGIQIRDSLIYDIRHHMIYDICTVLIEHHGRSVCAGSDIKFDIPKKYYDRLSGFTHDSETSIQGYRNTIGDIMHQDDPSIDGKNWVKSYHGMSRSVQVESALRNALSLL
jgi:non-canonical (house-cleaning) NTP pyrophosphatase